MRLWHQDLIKFLPRNQLIRKQRELQEQLLGELENEILDI